MDVDATTTTTTPKLTRLTDEERKKLAQEGRCFRCRRQGHMSRECPQNQNNKRIRTTDTSTPPPTASTTPPTTSPPTAPKKNKAQQIAAIIASMTEEERGDYLESQDQGFPDAEL
jgi:hypothetical protein